MDEDLSQAFDMLLAQAMEQGGSWNEDVAPIDLEQKAFTTRAEASRGLVKC